jgi:hypothetical protein
MSNRLEQEFPEVTWSATPPIGPGGVPPATMRHYLERGRQLRNQAIRHGVRAGGAAVLRGLVPLVAFIRCAAHALVTRRPARDCWAGSAHGA